MVVEYVYDLLIYFDEVQLILVGSKSTTNILLNMPKTSTLLLLWYICHDANTDTDFI
jgi:hypothetical protein